MPAMTVDPSLLTSLPSPSPSTSYSAPSPSPSSSTDEQRPRKRPRSELSSEERKEARAHRNRIAAQNSRDKRKAHYGFLEQRVAELEEENRRLRAGAPTSSAPAPVQRLAEYEEEKDRARERENEELRERIKTLEKGWDAVVKALAAQGLPTGIPAPPTAEQTTSSNADNTMVFPISPAPSHENLSGPFEFEFDSSVGVVESESTRHPAAGGLAAKQQQAIISQLTIPHNNLTNNNNQHQEPISDATMEDLFREILAPSPTSPTFPTTPALSLDAQVTSTSTGATPSTEMSYSTSGSAAVIDWESEAEMQRLLDMLPNVQSATSSTSTSSSLSSLGLDLDGSGHAFDLESEWDMERSMSHSAIGVF